MRVCGPPLLAGLLGDPEIEALLGSEDELKAMLAFEIALAEAEAEQAVIPAESAKAIATALRGFRPNVDAIRERAGKDGVVVPELIRQLREAVGEPHAQHVHAGATSQDVIDTALILRLDPILTILGVRLAAVAARLDELQVAFGDRALMGRTRMQAAVPIAVADRIATWRAPLTRMQARIGEIRPDLLVVQFGGAAGTLDTLGGKAPLVRAALARRLGLGDAPQWHSQRSRVADLANVLSTITGSLGKIGQDVALMAQDGGEIELAGGGRSSAMTHKQNPVDAETLVALARFNAVLLSGIHQALVHEQERSGAAWTLEWLILPQMLLASGASTRTALQLVQSIRTLG